MTDAFHSIESGLREKVIEHLFVGDLLRILWQRGMRDSVTINRAKFSVLHTILSSANPNHSNSSK
ncbi:MAG: hypothetical protein RIM72_03115 [Alphaproteobacteria bacterium]